MPKDTPLHKAANKGDTNSCMDIIEKGEVKVNEPGAANRTAFHRAVGGNHMDCAKYLLSVGADITIQDKAGRKPIHWASIGGHKEALEFILKTLQEQEKLEEEINAQTKSGMTALHAAAEGGKLEVVKLLLQAQADKTLDDGDGKKAVDLAKSKGHGAVEKLLKHGLNGDEGGSEGCVIA